MKKRKGIESFQSQKKNKTKDTRCSCVVAGKGGCSVPTADDRKGGGHAVAALEQLEPNLNHTMRRDTAHGSLLPSVFVFKYF